MVAVTLAAWGYLFHDARTMNCFRWMKAGVLWNLPGFMTMLAMWSIMMAAMMLPSVMPMVLMFTEVNRRRRQQGNPYVPVSIFLAGYIIVWTGFSLLATAIQFWLTGLKLLSMTMASATPFFAGGLLLGAGAFQFTPWKRQCLTSCANPLQFLMTSWRNGRLGALRMGLEHGGFCLGCCWAVMILLFVAGVMNLLWVAILSLFVLAEKLAPQYVARPGGVVMTAAGLWLIGSGFHG